MHIKLPDYCKEPLEKIAAAEGYFWGKEANLKAWLEAVALKEAQTPPVETLPTTEVTRIVLDLIERQQPFRLEYRDAANLLWSFTVCYAELAWHENRLYLDCWTNETDRNQDLPELRHNWCLRLDRIVDASFIPVEDEDWLQPGLDAIDVQLHLLEGLAHAYRPEPGEQVRWLDDSRQVKEVTLQITNSFWFLRKILPYGKDCVVLAPDDLRAKVAEHFRSALAHYEAVTP